jgi:hypothetical protein
MPSQLPSGWGAGRRSGAPISYARAHAMKIREAARHRERERPRQDRTTPPSVADALTRINLALAEDRELLALVGRLIEMPAPARRSLLDFLSSLGRHA